MFSKMSTVQEAQFKRAMEERKKLYEQLQDVVEGKQALVTTGAGWYADALGEKFKIGGVQNFNQVPHVKIEHNELQLGNVEKIKLIQWNHCKVLNDEGNRISIYELCRRIAREEKIISA